RQFVLLTPGLGAAGVFAKGSQAAGHHSDSRRLSPSWRTTHRTPVSERSTSRAGPGGGVGQTPIPDGTANGYRENRCHLSARKADVQVEPRRTALVPGGPRATRRASDRRAARPLSRIQQLLAQGGYGY